jgi:hypothetical protein
MLGLEGTLTLFMPGARCNQRHRGPQLGWSHQMAATLGTARYLQLIGFVTAALAVTGIEIVFGSWFNLEAQAQTVLAATGVLAYGVFALGTWSWFTSLEAAIGNRQGMARPLQIFSVAYLITAIGYLATTLSWAYDDLVHPYDGRRAIAVAVLYGMELAGFCLVSVAYWLAAGSCRRRRSLPSL